LVVVGEPAVQEALEAARVEPGHAAGGGELARLERALELRPRGEAALLRQDGEGVLEADLGTRGEDALGALAGERTQAEETFGGGPSALGVAAAEVLQQSPRLGAG